MPRQKMTEEQKDLTALFRLWVDYPTSNNTTKKLADGMLTYELKARLKAVVLYEPVLTATE